VKIVADEVERQVKKVLPHLEVFLAAFGTKLALHLSTAVEAIGFFPVFFMTHENPRLQGVKGRMNGNNEQGASLFTVPPVDKSDRQAISKA
jgi:hypothetical protein